MPIEVGDIIAIKVLRGKAFTPDSTSNELANASMAIECEVVSIEGKQVEADINVGNITVQEMVFDVKNGTVRVILRKFGWIIIKGVALNGVEEYKFRFEGMLHVERPRLVIVGLVGGFRGEKQAYRISCIGRVFKL